VDRTLAVRTPEGSQAPVRLTRRELEVLALIAQGQTGKEIALRLGIAPKTVEHYREKVKLKVGVTRTPLLVRYAVRVGLIAP
jgi:DNA-binding CsgD family transcriptional regulator